MATMDFHQEPPLIVHLITYLTLDILIIYFLKLKYFE